MSDIRMEVSRHTLIEEAKRTFAEPLGTRGYDLLEETPVANMTFWFQKVIDAPMPVFHIIEFKPRGPSIHDLVDVDVFLIRGTFQDYFDPPPGGKMTLMESLSQYYLEKSPSALYPWHFLTLDELRDAYQDILDRLLRYGIPLLENPQCGWEQWTGKSPLPT